MFIRKNISLLIKIILVFMLSWGISLTLSAQVSNSFDTNEEGWIGKSLSNGVPNLVITHSSTEGNPGGAISVSPPTAGGSTNTSMAWYWESPAAYMGDWDFSYGQLFSFDQKATVETADNSQSDVVITNTSGRSIHCQLDQKPKTTWTTYSIPLSTEAPWHLNSGGGRLARKYEIKSVLANIASIRIRCKYSNATGYTSYIDNVSLQKRALEIAPAITSFTPRAALPGTNVTITGTNFGSTASSNIVRFGDQKATIVTASATEIVATVPVGARFGPITVVNTNNSLADRSSADFSPLSSSDPEFVGRIIPSSFSTNTVIYYDDFNDNGLAGADMGDIDNDGLLDIVAFEDGQRKFAIFLNQGQTGSISSASFGPKIEIPSGELGQGNSYGLLIADLDNDGKLDITTYNRGRDDDPIFGGGFAVSRNISTPGNVAFETPERFFEIGNSCSGLDAADLDGDGRPEILINSAGFKMARNISTPGHIEFGTIRSVHAAGGIISNHDVNGDGKPEVFVANGATYYMFENTSTPGTINLETPVALSGNAVSGFTIADLDADDKPDITYYRGDGFNDYKLCIKKNIHTSGSLTADSFGPDIIISTIGRAYSQKVVDLNGDTKPEILIGYYPNNSGFVIYENRAETNSLTTASFAPAVYFEETATGSFAIPLIGDIDGDYKPDVVGFGSSDGGNHSMIIYRNECLPPPHIALHTVSPLSAPVGSTVTITGEKFSTTPEKNTVRFGAVTAKVLTASATQLTVEVPQGATYERVGVTRDFLTTRYHLPFSLSFASNHTLDATAFLPPVTFPLTGANYDVDIGDMDNDGKPDIVGESVIVTGIIRNYALSYKNLYTSGLISTSSFACVDTTSTSATDLRLVDIDEDGFLDIASSESYRNISTSTDIKFDPNVGIGGSSVPAWADFNLDGKTDLATVSGTIASLYENWSRVGPFRAGFFGTFSADFAFSKPGNGGSAVAGDFDNDGLSEFAATNPTTDNIRIWRNAGGIRIAASMFTIAADIPSGDNPGRLYAADFDLDGKMDFACYHNVGTDSKLMSVFHNTSTPGNISFTKVDYPIGIDSGVIAIGDLDGDGRPEIVMSCELSGRIMIFKNNSTPGVIDASSFATPFGITITGPRGLAIGDLNGDSKPEIVVARSGNQLSILENAIASGPVITINPQPVSHAVCDGVSTTFSLTATGADNLTYQWQKFDGGTFVNITNGGGYTGVTTATLGINTTGNFGAGDYRCLVKGDDADDKFSNTATLTVNVVPGAPTTNGDTNCIAGVLTLTASGGTNGQYRWYDVATGGTASAQVNGTFTTPAISVTTTYHVSINNGNCESSRTPVTATIAPLTKPTFTSSTPVVNGSVNLCDGQSVTLTGPNGFDYDWSTGATTQQITLSASATVTLVVDDGGGCVSPPSDPVNVIVNPYPDAIITVNNTELTSSPGDSYQWYQNGNEVNGASSQSFEINFLEYGVYAVEVTDNGCATMSDDFVYLITGTEPKFSGTNIYPNPVGNKLIIETAEDAKATFIDPLGRPVKTAFIGKNKSNLIETTSFTSGYYILILEFSKGNKYYKLNKIN